MEMVTYLQTCVQIDLSKILLSNQRVMVLFEGRVCGASILHYRLNPKCFYLNSKKKKEFKPLFFCGKKIYF